MIDVSVYKPTEREVFARKCPECGTLHYPVLMLCRNCGARRDPSGVLFPKWEKVGLSGQKCKLLTWTRLFALPKGFSDRYLLFGIVELENGLKASGRLLVDDPRIGMELTAKVGLVREKIDKDVYGFMFAAP